MKSLLFILIFLVCAPTVSAQSTLAAKEVTANMSKGINSGFEVEIPYAGVKEVEKDWKRRLSAGNKSKQSETNGEIAVKGIDNKDIAPSLFNVYAIISITERGVKLIAFFTFNDTAYFSSKSGKGEATAASKLVRDFAGAEYFLAVKNSYHTEREKLEKLKDELEKNIRAQEKANLKITENKRALVRSQDDLATNDNDQKEAIDAVKRQQAEVDKDRSGNAEIYKAADKSLKELQDAEKKLKNRNEELHKKTDEWTKEITAEERSIATAKQEQAKNADAIEKQKTLIKDLAAKMKSIK